MQKELSTGKIALSFAGCFLGAGFVSGQELWQFFGNFGYLGIIGIISAISLMALLGITVFVIIENTGITEIDRLAVPWECPLLRRTAVSLQIIFLFGVISIMYAGSGALLFELFGIPTPTGNAIICVIVFCIAAHGVRGAVSAFSLFVPIIATLTVIICMLAVWQGECILPGPETTQNFLMANWLSGCITYTCYNIFGNLGMIVQIGRLSSQKTALRGTILGGLILIFIAISILLALDTDFAVRQSELPMLSIAYKLSPLSGIIYGILLLLGMSGTAISCTIVLNRLISERFSRFYMITQSLIFSSLICFAGSLGGFGMLVSKVYPIFGCCSSIFIIGLLCHLFRCHHKKICQMTF